MYTWILLYGSINGNIYDSTNKNSIELITLSIQDGHYFFYRTTHFHISIKIKIKISN